MSEQPVEDRLVEARRRGVRRRLIDGGMNFSMADKWIGAWEVEAARRGIDPQTPDYWRAADHWITERTRFR